MTPCCSIRAVFIAQYQLSKILPEQPIRRRPKNGYPHTCRSAPWRTPKRSKKTKRFSYSHQVPMRSNDCRSNLHAILRAYLIQVSNRRVRILHVRHPPSERPVRHILDGSPRGSVLFAVAAGASHFSQRACNKECNRCRQES